MSKFIECNSKIKHYNKNNLVSEFDTNLYVFVEAQSTGSTAYADYSVWSWNELSVIIKEVGIHPDIE